MGALEVLAGGGEVQTFARICRLIDAINTATVSLMCVMYCVRNGKWFLKLMARAEIAEVANRSVPTVVWILYALDFSVHRTKKGTHVKPLSAELLGAY